MGLGDHPKTFLLKALCCQAAPSWLKVGGWVLGYSLFPIFPIPHSPFPNPSPSRYKNKKGWKILYTFFFLRPFIIPFTLYIKMEGTGTTIIPNFGWLLVMGDKPNDGGDKRRIKFLDVWLYVFLPTPTNINCKYKKVMSQLSLSFQEILWSPYCKIPYIHQEYEIWNIANTNCDISFQLQIWCWNIMFPDFKTY